MLKLKGDTLVEVTLAIGIFSMVAVIIVSVVNGSASSAQTALEITLAREEIDAQAEALRFLHSAYVSSTGGAAVLNNDSLSPDYVEIWKQITDSAEDKDLDESILKYSPSSCAELYDGDTLSDQKAFVINTKGLKNTAAGDIIVSAKDNKGKFLPASTYPRLISQRDSDDNTLFDDEDEEDNTNIVKWAEGIYVVAVKDIDGTNISGRTNPEPAYYDFYIRTCWYGPGADHPSTISTVIRLYNPNLGTI